MQLEVPDDLYEEFRLLVAKRTFETTPDEYAQNLIRRELGQNDLPNFAERDKLTGCHTRRQFEADLTAHLWTRVYSNASVTRFLCADIKGLKKQCETYGFPSGDQMIRDAADALRLAYPDVPVYRVGGDEFIVALGDGGNLALKTPENDVLKYSLVEVTPPSHWVSFFKMQGTILLHLDRGLNEARLEGNLITCNIENALPEKEGLWQKISRFGNSGPNTDRPTRR